MNGSAIQLNNKVILKTVNVADSLIKIADKFFKQYNVTTAQYNALVILNSAANKVKQSDLGAQLVVSRSDITGIVDRLEKRGYVKREDSLDDRRVKFIALTSKGKDLIKRVENDYFEKLKQIVRFLTIKDKEDLLKITTKIEKGTQGLGNE